MKTVVVGSGSWGLALAIMLCNSQNSVTLWCHSLEAYDCLLKYRTNKLIISHTKIPPEVIFTRDIGVCAKSDLIIIAVPSFAVREIAAKIAPYLSDKQIILSASKGLEENTHMTFSKVIASEIPNCQIAVMSGPCHAEEVANSLPTAGVVASKDEKLAEYIRDNITSQCFKISTTTDIIGVELGGALKNVIAICCGISCGLGFGDNAKAAIITDGMAEMTRLGIAMGAKSETFSGLAGVGDLIVTCTSLHSRNFKAGILIGKGHSIKAAEKQIKMTIEGVRTAKTAKRLASTYQIEVPIIASTCKILFENFSARSVVNNLMFGGRTHKFKTINNLAAGQS